jgi:outer membrane biosynthesis protein TonB
MNAAAERPINIKASAWTIGVHLVLLLLFMFLKYSLPVSEINEEMGMEVNLGSSDEGSGTDQPMEIDDPAPAKAVVNYATAAPKSVASREILRTDDADAPAINATSQNKKQEHKNIEEIKKPSKTAHAGDKATQQQQRPRYVFTGTKGKGGNSATENVRGSSEGNTTGTGDRGVPGGTPGATNYTGVPGNGTGNMNHTLKGRSISPNRFEAEFNEGGVVEVRVTVNRNGDIIDKRILKSASPKLSVLALQKLSQARFDKKPDGDPEQFGIITIVFKTRS